MRAIIQRIVFQTRVLLAVALRNDTSLQRATRSNMVFWTRTCERNPSLRVAPGYGALSFGVYNPRELETSTDSLPARLPSLFLSIKKVRARICHAVRLQLLIVAIPCSFGTQERGLSDPAGTGG
jgi:hypothetical protein